MSCFYFCFFLLIFVFKVLGSIIAAKVVEVVGTKIDIPRWKAAKQEIREKIAEYGCHLR